jgi:hypothetical protein
VFDRRPQVAASLDLKECLKHGMTYRQQPGPQAAFYPMDRHSILRGAADEFHHLLVFDLPLENCQFLRGCNKIT